MPPAIPENARQAMPGDRFFEQLASVNPETMFANLEDTSAALERQKQEADRIGRAFARVFSTEDGQEVLEWLLDNTLRSLRLVPGLDQFQSLMYVARRVGAEAIAWQLLAMIAHGREQPPPKQPEPNP